MAKMREIEAAEVEHNEQTHQELPTTITNDADSSDGGGGGGDMVHHDAQTRSPEVPPPAPLTLHVRTLHVQPPSLSPVETKEDRTANQNEWGSSRQSGRRHGDTPRYSTGHETRRQLPRSVPAQSAIPEGDPPQSDAQSSGDRRDKLPATAASSTKERPMHEQSIAEEGENEEEEEEKEKEEEKEEKEEKEPVVSDTAATSASPRGDEQQQRQTASPAPKRIDATQANEHYNHDSAGDKTTPQEESLDGGSSSDDGSLIDFPTAAEQSNAPTDARDSTRTTDAGQQDNVTSVSEIDDDQMDGKVQQSETIPTSQSQQSEPNSLATMRPSPISPRQASSGSTPNTIDDEWVLCVSEEGISYYYNPITQQSQWLLPHRNENNTGFSIDEFMQAASRNDEQSVTQLEQMLQNGMDVNIVNAMGVTALHVACQNGNLPGARMLVYYGANVDACALTSNMTPLLMACYHNHPDIVKFLVDTNASMQITDSEGNSVIHHAVMVHDRASCVQILSYLFEKCGENRSLVDQANAENESPLHVAAELGNTEAVALLLGYGAATNTEDSLGRTPLIASIMENQTECVQLLQSATGFANIQNSPSINSASSAMSSDADRSDANDSSLSTLQLQVFQMLDGADANVYNAVYQYVDYAQRQLKAMKEEERESQRREENHLLQLGSIKSDYAQLKYELEKEKDLSSQLQKQVETHELELKSIRASHHALRSRCDTLEYIARIAQEKLRRERAEHAHFEDELQMQLHTSMEQYADLLNQFNELHETWNSDRQQSRLSDAMMAQGAFYESNGRNYATSNRSFDQSNQQQNRNDADTVNAGNVFYRSDGVQDQIQPSFSQSNVSGYVSGSSAPRGEESDYKRHQMGAMPSTQVREQEPSTAEANAHSSIDPARVDAVWSRFFENVGRASEVKRSQQVQHNSFRDQQQQGFSPFLGNQDVRHPTLPAASALFDAVRKHDLNRVQECLASGLSSNQRDVAEKGTPLHLACELGDLEAVMLLCEYSADVEVRDEAGNTPLLVACFQGHFDCTQFLLQSAANLDAVNANGDTALHLAAWDGSVACVEILIEYGIDPFVVNQFGLTALANLKTRSPLRHKFDDLVADHPMRKTLVLLEEYEEKELGGDVPVEEPSSEVPSQSRNDTLAGANNKSSNRSSWTQWIFGFGNEAKKQDEKTTKEVADQTARRDTIDANDTIGIKEDDLDEYHEPATTDNILHNYEPLRPPPEIEEALRRAKQQQGQQNDHSKSISTPQLALSPSNNLRRSVLSPTSSQSIQKKTPASPLNANLRARYVDTFNNA